MKWLLETFNTLRTMNPSEVHIHLDTNGSLLTADYIDALVRCGMTDIGIDLKALELDTFMHITCTEDSAIAERYKNTAWDAVKYIIDNYSDKLFLGVGIPYNRELITLEEVRRMGERLARIDPKVQVCALDYRPEFRRMHLARPSVAEMLEVRNVLTSAGLERVMVQTALGHIGPDL
jgi:pyruvate formate lyase activating enzyme